MDKFPRQRILGACSAALFAVATVPALAQQNPGVSDRPAGQTLEGPPAQEELLDLSRQEPSPPQLDLATGEEVFIEPAMRGEAWAQTKLGKIYIQTPINPERRQKGLELLQQAAAQKDAEAIYLLAGIAAAGVVDQPSNIAAMEKIKEAATLGSADAQYELASMHAEGRGVHKDMNQALFWGRKAAQQGNTQAQFSVGRTLIESGPEERAEGLEYLRLAVAAKDRTAAIFLATVKARGDFGVAKDELAAEAILKPFAENGDAECQFALANLYVVGEMFKNNRDAAMQWLVRAAEAGHEKAQAAIAEAKTERTAH